MYSQHQPCPCSKITSVDGLPALCRLGNEKHGKQGNIGNTVTRVTSRGLFDKASGSALRIAVLNLMPLKEPTELHLLQALASAGTEIDVSWLRMATHCSRNTSATHIGQFYMTFDQLLAHQGEPDGVIITGAPIERLPFESVDYWPELTALIDRLRQSGTPVMMLCWAAFAGLYHRYGVDKHVISRKISGVYPHRLLMPGHPLTRGMEAEFSVPHSRFTEVWRSGVEVHPDIDILAESPESGLYLMTSGADGGRELYVTGHSEYDALTLDGEYRRDLSRGLAPELPRHYYPDNNPDLTPAAGWISHREALYTNWVNLCIERKRRQHTPLNRRHP